MHFLRNIATFLQYFIYILDLNSAPFIKFSNNTVTVQSTSLSHIGTHFFKLTVTDVQN